MRARHRNAAIAITVLALCLAIVLSRGGSTGERSSTTGEQRTSGARTASPSLPSAEPDRATDVPVGPTEDEVRAFRTFRVNALEKAARYPGDSGPLTSRHLEALTTVFPDTGAVTADEEPDPDSDGRQVRLVAYATKPHFQGEEPAVLHATVRDDAAERAVPAKIVATMRQLIGGGDRGSLGTLSYRDDGRGGDPIAGDLVYTATVTADTVPGRLLEGQIDLEVAATLVDGRQRFVRSVFRIGSPDARLTGVFSDHLDAGHLVIEAKVIVERPGRYHLQGGLVSLGGDPIAWAQNAIRIEAPGPATMSLRFFGLAFHEAGIAGPYRLSFISIAETERRPVLQGPVLRDAHVTAAYKLADFSDQPHHDPAMDETIEQARSLQSMPFADHVIPSPR